MFSYITSHDITQFISKQIATYHLNKMALTNIVGYFNGVFRYAVLNRLITENPMTFVEVKLLRKKCITKTYTPEERMYLLPRLQPC